MVANFFSLVKFSTPTFNSLNISIDDSTVVVSVDLILQILNVVTFPRLLFFHWYFILIVTYFAENVLRPGLNAPPGQICAPPCLTPGVSSILGPLEASVPPYFCWLRGCTAV